MAARSPNNNATEPTPKRSTRSQDYHVADSEGSIASLSDTAGTLHSDGPVKPSLQESNKMQGHLENDSLRDKIIYAFRHVPSKSRHQYVPEYIDKQGRLSLQYRQRYSDDVDKARKARKNAMRKESLLARKQHEDLTHLAATQRTNVRLQGRINRTRSAKNRRRFNDKDTGSNGKSKLSKDVGAIPCQPCQEKNQDCQRIIDSGVGLTCIPCIGAGEVCPLSAGRSLRKSRATRQPEPENSQSQTEAQLPGNPSLYPKPDSRINQAESYPNGVTLEKITERRNPKVGKKHQSSGTKPSVLPTNVSDATEPSEEEKSKDPDANQREQCIAARSVHETLQQQLQHFTTCKTCLKSYRLCQSQVPHEDIKCDGQVCSHTWFTNEYLEKYVGIDLSDAHEHRKKYGEWLCPECSYRKSFQDPRGPNVFAPTYELPKYGTESLETEDFSRPLREFLMLTGQYVHMGSKSTIPPNFRNQTLLQLPCVREEIAGDLCSPLIDVLRQLLSVEKGILVKDMVLNYETQNVQNSVWMSAVLAHLFFDFVFNSPCPFDEVNAWREGLMDALHSPELVEMFVQDNRLRIMNENAGSYKRRCAENRENHIRRLNAVMMPFTGGSGRNEGLRHLHERMVDIAGSLRARCSAYGDKFRPIMPRIHEPFDSELHVSDDPRDEGRDLSDRYVMLTSMFGIRYKRAGIAEQIWLKAQVRLWPALDNSSEVSDLTAP